MDLLLGCGSSREMRVAVNGRREWSDLVTLDNNPAHEPDVVHDLECFPYPFPDDTFDSIHAYEVLEHLGQQGDYRAFFEQFSELWRILKPGGFLVGTCPSWKSMWAWGDPSHRRVLTSGTLVFLDQEQYRLQVGRTPMSDFRHIYRADFLPCWAHEDDATFAFIIQAVKPSRWSLDTVQGIAVESFQT